MTTSQREFENALDTLDKQLARRKRWALVLIVVPAILATALVITSLQIVRETTARTQLLEKRAAGAATSARVAQAELARVQDEVTRAETALNTTRQAAANLGIVLFHQGNYQAAIRAYDSALSVDPGNAYLLNLKGYAYFKLKEYASSIATLQLAAKTAPSYGHSYFDLARAQCAANDFVNARTTAKQAIDHGMKDEMAADGEFIRLCRPLLKELGLPQVPTE